MAHGQLLFFLTDAFHHFRRRRFAGQPPARRTREREGDEGEHDADQHRSQSIPERAVRLAFKAGLQRWPSKSAGRPDDQSVSAPRTAGSYSLPHSVWVKRIRADYLEKRDTKQQPTLARTPSTTAREMSCCEKSKNYFVSLRRLRRPRWRKPTSSPVASSTASAPAPFCFIKASARVSGVAGATNNSGATGRITSATRVR